MYYVLFDNRGFDYYEYFAEELFGYEYIKNQEEYKELENEIKDIYRDTYYEEDLPASLVDRLESELFVLGNRINDMEFRIESEAEARMEQDLDNYESEIGYFFNNNSCIIDWYGEWQPIIGNEDYADMVYNDYDKFKYYIDDGVLNIINSKKNNYHHSLEIELYKMSPEARQYYLDNYDGDNQEELCNEIMNTKGYILPFTIDDFRLCKNNLSFSG